MRAQGLLHAQLLAVIAEMGHGETLVIADAGLAVPSGVLLVDLAIAPNLPQVPAVLEVVRAELVVESALVARETLDNRALATALQSRVRTHWMTVSHEDFKRRLPMVRAVVRTGDFTPFASIMLVAGVPFGPQEGGSMSQ